jgi:ribosomal protein L40E
LSAAPGKGGPAVRIPFSSRLQLSSNGATVPLDCSIASKYRLLILPRQAHAITGGVCCRNPGRGRNPGAYQKCRKCVSHRLSPAGQV